MKKRITLSAAISLMFVAMTVTFCLTMIASSRIFEAKVESVNEKEIMYDKIADIDRTVRQNFYAMVDDEQVLENMAAGYVAGLYDSESKYYSSEEVTEYQQKLDGKIIGIGMDFAKSREDSGYMKIYNVYKESPADVQGIVANDTITAINGQSTINMSVETAQEMLAGVSGETVDITYIHENTESSVTLTHKAYEAPSVDHSKQDDYGYIKVSGFSSKTASELDYATNNLISQGVKALVIDLRNNATKDFESAAAAADVLLKEGTTMYAVYNDGERKVLYTSDKNGVSVPVVLLTNSGTGYAAEMFAVMVKDIAGAKTVGTVTMGKGSLQKLYRLPDGSGVEITVATLSPVSSSVYNGTGIAPDYEKVLETAQEQNFYTLTVETDPQIQRAFEVAQNLVANQ
jgi:carboxyl-terminal processing protease